VKKQRATLFPQHFLVRLAGRARGIPRWMIGGRLARAFMQVEPALIPLFRQCSGSLASPELDPCFVVGDDVLSLTWLPPANEILSKIFQAKTLLEQVNAAFAPWGWLCARLDSLPPVARFVYVSPFKPDTDIWLKANNLKHTLRRTGPCKLECVFTPEALKKKIADSLEIEELQRGDHSFWKVTVRPALKFNHESFAQEAFKLARINDWVRIRSGLWISHPDMCV
jgi:hypothetical protein